MKIVAVDDDHLMLALISGALAEVGCDDVTLVSTAEEALQVFSSPDARFDCVLLDIMMPGFNGIELCQWLRNQPQYRETHVIMVTAKSDKADIDRAFAAGASGYLAKPFEVHQLCARVKAVEASLLAAQRGLTLAGDAHAPQVTDHGRVDFSDPITIPDVKSALSYNALANTVLRLPKLQLLGSRFFAFKIAGIGRIYASSTVQEFVGVLRSVAEAISASLEDTRIAFAYAGEGTFLCVARGPADHDLARIEERVNRHLRARAGGQPELTVLCGSQLRGGAFRTGQGVLSVLQLAIDSAVARVHAVQAETENITPPAGARGVFTSRRAAQARAS